MTKKKNENITNVVKKSLENFLKLKNEEEKDSNKEQDKNND